MIKGWRECKLGDVTSILGDGLHGTPNYDKNGEYFFINGNNLSNGKIVIKSDTKRANLSEYNKYNKNLNDRTILVSINGTLGNIALYNNEKCILGKSACYFNVNDDIDKYFIKYVVTNNDFQEYIRNFATGTTIPNVSLKTMREYKFSLPPLEEQKAIAEILSSLDDKIDLLHRQNQTLESIAQTLFRQWFVDFNYPDATREMIDSEMGEIPKSWRIGKIGDIVNIYDSQRIPLSSQQRELRKGIYPYYGATKIVDYIDDFIFDGTYLLFAEDGSVSDINDKPILQYVWGKFWVSNHTHILQGKNGFSTELLYIAFKNLNVSRIITGAVQPKINQANLLNYEILIPDKAVLNSFIQIINPIFNKFKSNKKQIQTLENLRDTLLPKLISGEVRIAI